MRGDGKGTRHTVHGLRVTEKRESRKKVPHGTPKDGKGGKKVPHGTNKRHEKTTHKGWLWCDEL